MTIRIATEQDTEAIVALLKLSLGDVSTIKSATYWRWKHIENPFGKSHVLIAEEDGIIVGIRAFMQWRWSNGSREFTALRAVDTATHPDYQGKGIFKKLTMELIDRRRAAGDDFIFNTPNDQSRPGYLKMGWQVVGRLPVALSIRRPVRMIVNRATGGGAGDDPHSTSSQEDTLWTGWENLPLNTSGSWRTAARPDVSSVAVR